jgi:hypothetical protein
MVRLQLYLDSFWTELEMKHLLAFSKIVASGLYY